MPAKIGIRAAHFGKQAAQFSLAERKRTRGGDRLGDYGQPAGEAIFAERALGR